jgi:hypothetical protein
MGKRVFNFFIYSNLFIAGCAVVMVIQTDRLLLNSRSNTDFLFFVFFSTICSYSFHWWLTISSVLPSSRVRWLDKNRFIHLVFFFVGLVGAAIYFFHLIDYWYWLFLSAGITFLYSAPKIPHPLFRSLRKLALGKTIFLALVWMNVTTLLPLLISGETWRTEFMVFIIHRFFLIYAICILFDYRDRADDIASGIKSLVTFLNEKGISLLFIFSILVFFVSTTLLSWFGYPMLTIAVLLLPGVITAILYKQAMKKFSDMFYYFLLDGMMALSAIIMLIPFNWLTLPTK